MFCCTLAVSRLTFLWYISYHYPAIFNLQMCIFVSMEIIFLIAAFNALFFSVLLAQKKPKALHDRVLIIWLIYLGLYVGVYGLYSHELFTLFHLLSISLLSCLMLLGPFLYFYLSALVFDKKRMRAKDSVHLLPFLAFNLYILLASFSPDWSEKLNIEKIGAEFHPPFLFLFFLIMTALSGTVYFLISIRLFKKLDIHIFNHYSNYKGVDLGWIRKLVLIFGIVWTALISVTVIHHVFHLFSMVFCTDGLFLSLSVFILLIGFFGLKQKIVYPQEVTIQTKYAGSKLSNPEASLLAEKLKNHMETSQTYLNPDLTLAQLAEESGLSSHLLSQVINEKFQLNFFDFVNHYRVEAFKQRLNNPEFSAYSLLGNALDCGFNSKSAFNRIFKKETGVTPSHYKEQKIGLTL